MHGTRLVAALLLLSVLPHHAAEAQRRGNAPTQRSPSDARCTVARVVDGDTLECTTGDRVRLLMIDTPELGQRPYGSRARNALLRLVPVGTDVRLEFDVRRTDRYDRLLAFVWTADGTLVNEEMLRLGMAEVLVIQPNVKYVERMRAARDKARRDLVGLWDGTAFECTPRQWRDGRC